MPNLWIFVVYFAAALLLGTVLAYPIHIFLSTWFELDFARVASRSVLIMAVILFIALYKWLGFKSWKELGFGPNKNQFLKDLAKGIAFGILIMTPVILVLLITQNRTIDTDWNFSLENIAGLFVTALAAGLIISLLEETLFRGAMLTALQKQSSILFAIVCTSFVYALVHFLEPSISFDNDSLHWGSGLVLLKNSFIPLTQVNIIIDSFLALFLAGILLALVRIRTDRIALCMGIHAGWVITIKVFKRVTDTNTDSNFAFLTGSYDKVIGYLAAICIIIFILLYLKTKPGESQIS